MSLESSKYIGGIGSLLIVIGVTGLLGAYLGILTLVGAIMVLVAAHGLADHYKERGIFNNMLYAVIILILGAVIAVFVLVFGAISAFAELGYDFTAGDWEAFGRMLSQGVPWTDFGALWGFLVAGIAALVVLFIFAILAAVFFRKSLDSIASKTGVRLFATGGLLMLIGAVLTIVLIGFLIMWIAWIVIMIAFFTMKT